MSSFLPNDRAGFWRAKGRPVMAYCAALVVAGFVGHSLWVFLSVRPTEVRDILGVLIVGLLLSGYFAIFAGVPTIGALALVRKTSMRRGVADTLAGGLIGALLVTVIYKLDNGLHFNDGDLVRAAKCGLAGMAGGLTYWFANGRPQSRADRIGHVPHSDA